MSGTVASVALAVEFNPSDRSPARGAAVSVINWEEFKSPKVLAPWLSGAAVVIGVILTLGYAVLHTMPRLQSQQDELQKAVAALPDKIQGRLDKVTDDVRGQIKELSANNSGQLSVVNLSISNLKNNVMDLCLAARSKAKGCNFHALIAQAKGNSDILAGLVDLKDVKLAPGATGPQVASASVKEELPVVSWGASGVTTYYPNGRTTQATADAILWINAADAKWEQKGDQLMASFKNGEATFQLKSAAKGHTTELVKSLNGTAEALQVASYAYDGK
jgi:hypothetical protein